MRKLSVIWGIFIVISLCSAISPANAYGETVIQTETVSAAPGETVSIALTITGNPGIVGAELTVTYPEDSLRLESATAGEAFNALVMTPSGTLASPCKFVWDGSGIASDDVKDGVILMLEFSVSSTVQAGDELPIALSASARDNDLSPVSLRMVNGIICITGNTGLPNIAPISSALNSSTFTVTLQSSDTYSGILLVAAAYSDDGKQSGYELKTVDLHPGNNTYQFKASDTNTAYRVFVLDGYSRPCCPAVWVGEQASTAATIYGSSVTTQSGAAKVGVTFSIRNNPGIAGLQFTVSFDNSVLTLTDVTRGSALASANLTIPGQLAAPCNFVWDATEVSAEQITDGGILTLWFNVAAGAAGGVYPVSLSNYKATDNNVQAIVVALEDASIRVTG